MIEVKEEIPSIRQKKFGTNKDTKEKFEEYVKQLLLKN